MPIDAVKLTQELVRIPSVNPMGRDVSGPEYFETRVTDFLQEQIASWGLPCERHPVFPGRDNLITRVDGRGQLSECTVLLEAHQDTVPVDGMTIPPFDANRASGRIWGRGSCDVKGGLAAALTAVMQLEESSAADLPTVVMAMTINEENGFDGIKHLRETWQSGRSTLLPRAPDFAIVTEPTELNVIVAHKGCVRWKAHTTGRAAHSSDPSAGCNAIYRMAALIQAVESYANNHLPPEEHPLVGPATMSVGTITGGVSVNTIPDRCTIEIDRRLLPDESPSAAYEHLLSFLSNRELTDGIEHDAPYLTADGLDCNSNQSVANSLTDVCRQLGLTGLQQGVPFGTDAGTVAAAGIPTVVFGPGSIDQAHTRDEWIEIPMLQKAVDVLCQFCQTAACLRTV